MYSHYMDGSFSPIGHQASEKNGAAQTTASQPYTNDILGEVAGGITRLIGGVKNQFSLDRLDTGDILLVLIILFLFLEGDNLELVITLGLMLLLGLGDD